MRRCSRREFVKAVGIGAAAIMAPRFARGQNAPAKRPNVILILTDDQGWADAYFSKHPYVKTPGLDRLASQGAWFKQFYVCSPVCSPSRCSFMTSHFPARHEIHGHFATPQMNKARHMPNWLDPKVTTVTKLFKDAGYATAHFGKWHLGSGEGAPTPGEYGIDVHKTVGSSGPALGGEVGEVAQPKLGRKADPFFRARSTAMIVDETIRFIQENKDKPFYVNLWTLLPHAPLKPTPAQLKVYEGLAPKSDDPAFGPWMQKYLAAAKDLRSQMQVFCASITDLDEQIGRLMKALDDVGLADDTIVVFSSDNGPEDYRIGNAANAGVGSTGPLRGRKRSLYEGGVRTFGLVRWPGHVASGRVDETSVLSAVDFLPTVCKIAGIALPAGLAADGEDVSDILLGASRPRTKPIMWEWLFPVSGGGEYQPPQLAVRDGNWKLFVNHDGTAAELYDIPNDTSELKNVASDHPDVVARLSKEVLDWQATLPPTPDRKADASSKTGGPQ